MKLFTTLFEEDVTALQNVSKIEKTFRTIESSVYYSYIHKENTLSEISKEDVLSTARKYFNDETINALLNIRQLDLYELANVCNDVSNTIYTIVYETSNVNSDFTILEELAFFTSEVRRAYKNIAEIISNAELTNEEELELISELKDTF